MTTHSSDCAVHNAPALEARPCNCDAVCWTKYRRTNIAEMRPIVQGEDLEGISISGPDNQLRYDDPATFDLGFIARNPKDHADQWYVARAYFDANFAPLAD